MTGNLLKFKKNNLLLKISPNFDNGTLIAKYRESYVVDILLDLEDETCVSRTRTHIDMGYHVRM